MNDFTAFTTIIEELIALFDHLIPIEQEKLDAAVKNRVTFVEDCRLLFFNYADWSKSGKRSRSVLVWAVIRSDRF